MEFLIGETPTIFFDSRSRITIAKTIYKINVAIFHVRKYERHFSTLHTYKTLRHHSEYCMTFSGNAGI